MGESLGTVAPVAIHIDNQPNVSTSQQAYENPVGPLRVDTCGMDSTPYSIAYSATIDEKPINVIKKKKKKRKGKQCGKFLDNGNWQGGPVECDKNTRTSYFQSHKLQAETAVCNRKGQLLFHADSTSVCTCETNGVCLKDETNHCGPCHLVGFVHSDNKSTIGDTIICGRDVKNIVSEGQKQKGFGKKIIMKCSYGGINELKENRSSGDLSQNMDSTMSSTSEDSHGGRTDKEKLSSQNTGFRNAYSAYSSGRNDVFFQSDVGNKTRFEYSIQTGKENSHLARQKIKKYSREVSNQGIKTLNHVYVPKDSFASNGLLPNPVIQSARHHFFPHEGVNNKNNKQATYRRPPCNILVESSKCIAHHRCHSGFGQVDSELMQDDICWHTGLGTLKQKRCFRYTQEGLSTGKFRYTQEGLSTGKKRAGDFNSNLKSRNKTSMSQREVFEIQDQACQYFNRDYARRSVNHSLDESHGSSSYPASRVQVDLPHITMSGVVGCTLFPGVQPYTCMKTARTEHGSVESLHDCLEKVHKHPLCSDFKISREDSFREDFSSRGSLQKWIPVNRKNSEVIKKVEAVYDCSSVEDVPDPCTENAALCTEHKISVASSSVDSEKACLFPAHDNPQKMSIESKTLQLDPRSKNTAHGLRKEHAKDYPPSRNIYNATPLLCIGSQVAIKNMNASYRLQIISESIQLAVGSPLAEFEKLLQLASPVIASSSALQYCNVCLRNPLPFTSLCKHQVANISLRDIWVWYEKPGNYGLEVKAEDWNDAKGMDINPVSFNAHFVPFLSAVQLFSHSKKSNHSNDIRDSEIRGKGGEDHFHIEESLNELENSPVIISDDGNDISCLSSVPSCSSDMELVFEFFESEQPQRRKPLYDKVRDIINLSTFNHQVFGDSSKLDCSDLHNIHPASWYSVAWYPIYRIPEGNFRASFLTYHSLGHFIHKCTPEPQRGDRYSVVSPALGMQSYNAQGECWFCPNDLVESSFKGTSSFTNSEILKQRLQTLEEAAVTFARGCVDKDHVKVTNRQPDYEFFLSRKQ